MVVVVVRHTIFSASRSYATEFTSSYYIMHKGQRIPLIKSKTHQTRNHAQDTKEAILLSTATTNASTKTMALTATLNTIYGMTFDQMEATSVAVAVLSVHFATLMLLSNQRHITRQSCDI